MSVHHENLLEEAEKAADHVFSDTSVALVVTLASLQELREHVDSLIEAVKSNGTSEDDDDNSPE